MLIVEHPEYSNQTHTTLFSETRFCVFFTDSQKDFLKYLGINALKLHNLSKLKRGCNFNVEEYLQMGSSKVHQNNLADEMDNPSLLGSQYH